jgi:hypothetical protein
MGIIVCPSHGLIKQHLKVPSSTYLRIDFASIEDDEGQVSDALMQTSVIISKNCSIETQTSFRNDGNLVETPVCFVGFARTS